MNNQELSDTHSDQFRSKKMVIENHLFTTNHLEDSSTLIISDLHLGHPGSHIDAVEQLIPLFRSAETVIFNGDTVEQLGRHNESQVYPDLDRITDVCLNQNTLPVFINGNHDPDITKKNHLELNDRQVLITHGDVLFDEIAPWCQHAQKLKSEYTQNLSSVGKENSIDFIDHLNAVKLASLALEKYKFDIPKGKLRWFKELVTDFGSPLRLLKLLKTWQKTPKQAASVARSFRPMAKYIIIGHTHRAGVWRVGEYVVINTGSFMPLSGRYAVMIEGKDIEVRKIKFENCQFVLGHVVKKFRLPIFAKAVEPDSQRNRFNGN